MSNKSRRQGRHLSRSKRKKLRKGFSAPVQPAAAAPQQYEPAPRAEVAAPPARAPAPHPAATPVQITNVAAELRMIGILSGIIVAILIALVYILP